MSLDQTLKDHLDKIPSYVVPPPASSEELPVIDLAGGKPDDALMTTLGGEVSNACLGIGFFYVTNHGVPKPVLDNVFEVAQRFFALPLEEKQKVQIEGSLPRGFLATGVNKHPGFAPDLKTSFEFGVDLPPTHPSVVNQVPLHGPNKWPKDHPWLKEACEPYFNAMNDLGRQLVRIFSVSLGLEAEHMLQFFDNPLQTSKLFYYPPQDPISPANAFGVAPHTDYGAVTILAQDPIGGLEVKTRSGDWATVPYIEDTLVINVGDMFRLWTNDRYVSNPHRVVNRTGKKRYSVPTFFNPNYDALISCLPAFQSAENPPKYPPTTAGDYMMSRYRSTRQI